MRVMFVYACKESFMRIFKYYTLIIDLITEWGMETVISSDQWKYLLTNLQQNIRSALISIKAIWLN